MRHEQRDTTHYLSIQCQPDINLVVVVVFSCRSRFWNESIAGAPKIDINPMKKQTTIIRE